MPIKADEKGALAPLGFGGAPVGNLYRAIDDETAFGAIEAAYMGGIRLFDTAPYYGFGLSEMRIGQVLRQYDAASYQISTKVGRLLEPDFSADVGALRDGFLSPLALAPVYDYSYDGVMKSVEASLKRLGLPKIDILLAHDLGEMVHGSAHDHYFNQFAQGGYKAMAKLRDEGVVSAIGLGVNEAAVCARAMDIGQFDLFLLAGRYSLLEQDVLADFFPKCDAYGAKLILGGVFNSGILASGAQNGGPLFYNYGPAPDDIIEKVRTIEAIAADFGVALPALALQFARAHPLVMATVLGFDSAQRVAQNMASATSTIPPQIWDELKTAGLLAQDAPVPRAQ